MANCHHRLEDPATAEKFYKMFLDSNWEPEKYGKEVAYAKEYQRRIGFSVSEKGQAYQEKQSCQITRSGRESCSVGARIGRISIDVNNPEGKAGWEDEYVIELKPTGDINKEFGVDWNRPHSVGSISTSKPDFISILPKFRYQMQQYLILRLGDAENNQIAGVMDFMKPDQKYPPFDLYLDRDRDGDLA